MKKKILITAFEPFAGRSSNPALEVMKTISPSHFAGCVLQKARLPVTGRTINAKISGLISGGRPDGVISLGLSAGETSIRVERFALNIRDYGIKDNGGWKPEGEMIRHDGPAAYFVNSDPVKAAAAVRKAGIPAYVSNHAGAYVCNDLMYCAMDAITTNGMRTKFSFIHLPLSCEMTCREDAGRAPQPSLPLKTLITAVERIIKASI